MITLSGQQTLADLPKLPTGAFTQPGGTQGGTQATQGTRVGTTSVGATSVGPTGTKVGSDEATLMERGFTPTQQTMSGSAPTQMERRGTIGSDEATVMENFGRTQAGGPAPGAGAAPTMVERKWAGDTGAEATVLERQISPGSLGGQPPKSKTGMYAAIAAVVLLVIAGGGWWALRKPTPPGPTVTTTAASGTNVTTTGSSLPNIPPDRGVLLLSASPWGDIEKIVNSSDQKEVPLTGEDRSTPTRIQLAPGKYMVTLSGPAGTQQTFDVQIDAGKQTLKKIDTGGVNLDELEKEVSKQ
jgi:hypothetical protein